MLKLVQMATAGNIDAAKLLMERCLGKMEINQASSQQQANLQINLNPGEEEDRAALERARANMAKAEAFLPPLKVVTPQKDSDD